MDVSEEIMREELRRRLHDPSLTIVDVLPASSYVEGHIPGAMSLPVEDVRIRAPVLLPDRDAEIVAYCGGPTCPRAEHAASLLRELGYSKVRHYHGGIAEWTEAGEPLESSHDGGTIADQPPRTVALPARNGGPRSEQNSVLQRWTAGLLDLAERWSTARLFGVWLAMVVVSGCIYWFASLLGFAWLTEAGRPVGRGLQGLATAIYFSFVTTSSVGYGDVLPVGPARLIAIFEAVAGLLIFGAVVAKFVSRRQEELVLQIHRTTFEDRLNRVQTNLHLCLSDFLAIASICDGSPTPSERIAARLDSAALVFVGEMHTIHDLLYKPQRMPDDGVLAAILANLASSLRILRDLLTCLPPDFSYSPVLGDALKRISSLAEEICSDCVPRAYAPVLANWMDRIREMARLIA
jgi:rhodanese-related sulfurtransferase